MIPSFITGANAKIKIDNITLAYAQDVSYRVKVQSIPIETISRYEVVSYEPVAYYVNGTLSVVRYTAGPSRDIVASSNNGNAVNEWIPNMGESGDWAGKIAYNEDGSRKIIPIKGKSADSINNHIDPASMLLSKSFQLVIYQTYQFKATSTQVAERTNEIYRLTKLNKEIEAQNISTVNIYKIPYDIPQTFTPDVWYTETETVCTLKNCRINTKDGRLNKKTPLIENIAFHAVFQVDDKGTTGPSQALANGTVDLK